MSAQKDAEGAFGGRELVYCVNGPRAGAWYFLAGAESWHTERNLALREGETAHTGRTLGYVPTQAREPHPLNAMVEGYVLAWAPDVAAAAMEKRAEESAEKSA